MNSLKRLALAVGFVSLLAAALPANALVWFESSKGAGETIATAEVTASPVNQPLTDIFGTLSTVLFVNTLPRYQVDLYKIYISDYTVFTARTVSATPDDTKLFLFNSAGKGVYSNDDNGFNLLSLLPAGGPRANDFYFLGISVGGFIARDASMNDIFPSFSFTDVVGASPLAGSLASFEEGFASFGESRITYDIALTGARVAAVPEPSTVLLMLAGFGGLLGRSTRRKNKARPSA